MSRSILLGYGEQNWPVFPTAASSGQPIETIMPQTAVADIYIHCDPDFYYWTGQIKISARLLILPHNVFSLSVLVAAQAALFKIAYSYFVVRPMLCIVRCTCEWVCVCRVVDVVFVGMVWGPSSDNGTTPLKAGISRKRKRLHATDASQPNNRNIRHCFWIVFTTFAYFDMH